LTGDVGLEPGLFVSQLTFDLEPELLRAFGREIARDLARGQLARDDAGEWKRHLHAVPASGHPLPANAVEDRDQCGARALREQDQPRLHLAPRPARPVDEVTADHRPAQQTHARMPPRELEPRTGRKPTYSTVRAMRSPSRLWLIIT
jgi:hypothetical protein